MARRQSLMNAIARARNCKIAAGAGESSAGRSGVTRFVLADGSVQEAMITGELKRADIPAANLVSIEIGTNVTSIGDSAFFSCYNLTNVTIPDSVTSIGDYAFSECSELTSVTIPDSVTSIGNNAFSGCSGLTSVTIPDGVTSIGDSAFYDTPFYNGQPDGLVVFGKVAYKMKGTCPASVTIPDGVTSIGDWAFDGCSGLTSVTIPNSVTSIGEGAFSGCSGLTSVTIPDSVTSIGYGAFEDCSGLTSVTFDGTTVPIGQDVCFCATNILNDIYMLNISVSDVQSQLDGNISHWGLGLNNDDTYHTVTIHCVDGEVVIEPTPSGSSSS